MAAAAMASRIGGNHAAGIYSDMTVDGPEIGTLVLVIDRAKNLPNRKTVGKQNPYCAARLGKEAKKTDTDMRGGQTPRWDQELRWTVHDSPDYYKMKVSVFSEDKRTDLIGETFISLESVIVPGGGKNDLWHTLNYKGRYAGEIRIEITYWDSRPRADPPVKRSADSGSQSQRRPLPSEARRFDSPPAQIPGGRREPDQVMATQTRPLPQMRMHNSDPSVMQSDVSFEKQRTQSQEQKNREAFEFRQAQARRLGGADVLPRHDERAASSTPRPVYQGMALPELPNHVTQRASMSNLADLRQAQRPEYVAEQRHLQDDRTATMRSLPPQQTHSSLVPQNYAQSTPLRYSETNQESHHGYGQQYESPASNADAITPWRDEYYHQNYQDEARYDDNSATPWRNQYDASQSEDNSMTPWRNQYAQDEQRQDDYNVTPWRQNYQGSSPPVNNAPPPPTHRGSSLGSGQLMPLPPPDQQQAMLQHLYRPVAQRPDQRQVSSQTQNQRPYSSDDRMIASYHNQSQRYDNTYDLAYADAPFPPAPHPQQQQYYPQQHQNSSQQGLPPRTSSRLDPPSLPFAPSHQHRRSEPNIRPPFGQSPPQSQSQSQTYTPHSQSRGSVGGVPARKSVSPQVAASPSSVRSRQSLSTSAFSPDSFDSLNPRMSSSSGPSSLSTSTTPSYKTASESKTAAREVATLKKRRDEAAKGPVLGNNGRVIDPSDHLPSDTWAPEPEKKTSNSPAEKAKFRGAQPMPPSGRTSTGAGATYTSESPLREISNYNYDDGQGQGRYVGQPPPVPAKIALDGNGKKGRENSGASRGSGTANASASLADAMGKLDVSRPSGTGTGRLRRSRWGA